MFRYKNGPCSKGYFRAQIARVAAWLLLSAKHARSRPPPPLTPSHIPFERFKHKLMFLFLSPLANERFCRSENVSALKMNAHRHDETIRQRSRGKVMTGTKLCEALTEYPGPRDRSCDRRSLGAGSRRAANPRSREPGCQPFHQSGGRLDSSLSATRHYCPLSRGRLCVR